MQTGNEGRKPDKIPAWHLPWKGEKVPHALLDIIRGCNIACKACYNCLPAHVKPLAEIEQELDFLLSRRRLDSVLLVGGEVLLHPEIMAIVKMVKSRGLVVELITNALLLDDAMLAGLRDSGANLLFLHIDRGQRRPDLPPSATHDELTELWRKKTEQVARYGIDVGLTMTAFGGETTEIAEMVEFALASDCVNYMLVTLFRDSSRISDCRGDIYSGLKGRLTASDETRSDVLTNYDVHELLKKQYGLLPFCYLGSNLDAGDPRWMSYLVPVSRDRHGGLVWHSMKVSLFEKLYMALAVRLTGKYPMYRGQNTKQLLAQLVINGVAGGRLAGNLKFLAESMRKGSKISTKRLLFQCPADIRRDGTVVHCSNCPDAVVKNGTLVPVCISDKVCN